MGNIHTYLNWRGDLELTEHPFCEADNLTLAVLSYLDLEGIVPDDGRPVFLKDAYERYRADTSRCFREGSAQELLFRGMSASRRFGAALLSHYRTVFDEDQETQFAALQITLADGTHYLSFRGTDNSIVGWQEDFNMGSAVVPAQREALRYVEEVMIPGEIYRIGGHSKGGNLAIYASLYCREELAPSILAVYNNDGPGLSADIVPPERYRRIDDRLHWIIPEYSVIGTLFPHNGPTKIVASSGEGLLQHDPFTWQIEGGSFMAREGLSQSCQFYVDIFDTWINSADLAHRKVFTQDFFGALKAGGAKTIEDVLGGGVDGFGTILLSIIQSEGRTKIVIGKFIQSFLGRCRGIDLRAALRSKAALHGGLLLVLGILLMLFPGSALRLFGTFAGGAAILLLGRRILACAVSDTMAAREKKLRIISCLVCIGVVELLVVNHTTIMVSSHVLLGLLLLFFAFRTIYQAAEEPRSALERLLMCAGAVIALLLGVVAFTKNDGDSALVFTLGTFSVAYGLILLGRAVYHSGAQKANAPLEKGFF